MTQNNRIAKWDNLKLFLIFTVVLGHICDRCISAGGQQFKSLFVFIYLFHMPAFFFISGMFSKRAVNSKDYGKVWSFIKRYFCCNALLFTVSYICKGKGSLNILATDGLPWFMLSIATMFLAAILLRNVDPKWVMLSSVLLSLFSGFFKSTGAINADFLAYMRTINFFPFFYLGYAIDREKLTEYANKKWVRIASAVGLVATAAVCFLCKPITLIRPMLTGRNFYTVKNFSSFGPLVKLGIFAASLALIFMLISVTPNKRFRLSILGERTLSVYFFSNCIVTPMFTALHFDKFMAVNFPRWFFISIFAIAAIITLLFSLKIFSRPIEWIMNNKNKLKKQNN